MLAVVLPQALFTYVLIYWILPDYFFTKKSLFNTASIIIGLLLLFLFVFASFKSLVVVGDYFFGVSKSLFGNFTYNLFTYVAGRDQLTSLPIVAGFALMIKLMKRWWLKQEETAQLAIEKTRSELELLKAQVHPHFLFNTLNNIYYFTLSGSPKAPEMINKLSGLLQYIINECSEPLVPVQKELAMIRDYMALEKIRYGEEMDMSIEMQNEDSENLIAPLLLIPFVENSFKHGTSNMIVHPWVKLRITIEKGTLLFFISNSQPLTKDPHLKKGHIGLKNVKQRLQLLYPRAHELKIVSEAESFTVNLKIGLLEPSQLDKSKTTNTYAVA